MGLFLGGFWSIAEFHSIWNHGTRPIWPTWPRCWRHPKRCSVALTVALHLPLPTTCRRPWHCCGWCHQRKFLVLPQVQTIPNHKMLESNMENMETRNCGTYHLGQTLHTLHLSSKPIHFTQVLQQEHRNVHIVQCHIQHNDSRWQRMASPAISSNRNAALQWPLMAELKLMMSWMACTNGGWGGTSGTSLKLEAYITKIYKNHDQNWPNIITNHNITLS